MTHRTGLSYASSLAVVVDGLEAKRIAQAIDREADGVRARLVPGAIELSAESGLPVEDCSAALVMIDLPTARSLIVQAREMGWSLAKTAELYQRVAPPVVDFGSEIQSLRDSLAKSAREHRDDLILAKAAADPAPRNRAERRTAERAARRLSRLDGAK